MYVALFDMLLKESIIIDCLALFFIDKLTLNGITGNIFAMFSGISFAVLTLLLRNRKMISHQILFSEIY